MIDIDNLQSGTTIRLGDLLRLVERDAVDTRPAAPTRGTFPHQVTAALNAISKHFYQNSCWCAGGKCERCHAPDCSDRGWREEGRPVP